MNEEIKNSESPSAKDFELVKAFQSGNKAAFDALVIRHKDKVFSLCCWFLGNSQDANDSAQDIFMKVFQSLKKFRFNATFSTWLYRIAANTCKNRLKSSNHRRKKKMVCIDNPGQLKNGQHSAVKFNESLTPLAELEKKEKMMLIQRSITSLPADQRTVVVLRDIEGLSYEAVSNITGLNPGTVKSRLSRARQQLRKQLRGLI